MSRLRKRLMFAALLLAAALPTAPPAEAKTEATADREATPDREAAIAFLVQSQQTDGGWGERERIGVTALATHALLRNGRTPDDPTVADALAYLRGNAREDGGFYVVGSTHKNYSTALTYSALKAADRAEDAAALASAVGFLRGLQWDEGEGAKPGDEAYGGAGYGSHERPDLSNTQVFIEALKEAGLTADDPAMKKALVFVSRSQNLDSQHNRTKVAGLIDDGGFYYTPAAGGSSQAGALPNGGLRSYASMTYAGLKSMVYAGLTKDDPRVQAATKWISQHYTLDRNPGLDQQGLFYYYLTFAKTLDALGEPTFTDSEGTSHDWRADLRRTLAEKQNDDGSWTNPADRWMEGNPVLVTSYALLAASYGVNE